MKHICKRLLALLLVLASLLTAPAMASSFRDITREDVAAHVDALRLLGVVNGSGNGQFSPDRHLTRGEFCAMVIRLLGREDEVRSHLARTIFRDVASSHWARGYVNLASTITVGDGSTRLIAGIGDGRFLPDDPITYAQAVTILLRLLDYGDDRAGGVWPDGYLNLAAGLNVGQGLSVASGAAMSRGQASELLCDLLLADTAAGTPYYAALGSAQENVVILSVGGDGTLHTSAGDYAPALSGFAATGLTGHRGILILDAQGRVRTFLPQARVESRVLTLRADAGAAGFEDVTGVRYTVAAALPVYLGSASRAYALAYRELKQGSRVSLLMENGAMAGLVLLPEDTSAAKKALVVTEQTSEEDLTALAGGAAGWKLVSAGREITPAQLNPYDAVTYDGLTNTLQVSDLRLPCYYTEPSPDPASPTQLTALGHTFPVVESARSSIAACRLGDPVTLLLTADGAVAGMVPETLPSTAVGLADASGVSVFLPQGGTLYLGGAANGDLAGSLVRVSGDRNQQPALTKASGTAADGDLDTAALRLGSVALAPMARIFESFSGSGLRETSLRELGRGTVLREQVVALHLNSAGLADILVLGNLTGDIYTYGLLSAGTVSYSDGYFLAENAAVKVKNSDGVTELIYSGAVADGVMGGAVSGSRKIGSVPVAGDVVQLITLSGVRREDFFSQGEDWYLRWRDSVYPVSREAQGYIRRLDRWLTGDLQTLLAYASAFTAYADPIGGCVRIVEMEI